MRRGACQSDRSDPAATPTTVALIFRLTPGLASEGCDSWIGSQRAAIGRPYSPAVISGAWPRPAAGQQLSARSARQRAFE